MASSFLRLAGTAPAISPVVSIQQIAFELGTTTRSMRYHIAYITGLQESFGFPRPHPLFWRGRWIETVHPQSRWPRVAVERWFHDRLPPEDAAAIDKAADVRAGEQMDRNALTLIQGGRR